MTLGRSAFPVKPGLPDVGGNCRPASDGQPSYELPGAIVRFTVRAVPMGKPTMTQADRWKERPCVLNYRAWADAIRQAAELVTWPPALQGRILVVSYLPIPPSYSKTRQVALRGQPCQVKPDEDNILKGVKDALFEEDSFIWNSQAVKLYDDGNGPRTEVSLA